MYYLHSFLSTLVENFSIKPLYSLVSALLLMVPTTHLKSIDPIKTSHRNLIIINGEENIARKSNFFLTSKLLSALMHATAPILVSTTVWQHFVERKQEFIFRASQKETKEHYLLHHHTTVLEKLAYWTTVFRQTSATTAEMKQLVIQQMADEVADDVAILKERNLIQKNLDEDLLFSFFSHLCSIDQWSCYRVNDYYCLLVPQKYTERMISEHASMPYKGYTTREVALGLKIDHLEHIENALDFSVLTFQLQPRKEYDFLHALQELFINKKDIVAMKLSYAWNIFFTGHGGNSSLSFIAQKFDIIGELSVDEFRKFLIFMNESITTSIFIYTTCFGAGQHLQEPYIVDGKPLCFNYPIIINNITDVVSYGFWHYVLPPVIHEEKFILDCYIFNEESGQWRLDLDDPQRRNHNNWDKFWQEITAFNKNDNPEKLLTGQFLEYLGQLYIENIPNIRFAGSDRFVIYSPVNAVKINEQIVALKKYYKKSIIVDHQIPVLLEIPFITAPLLLKKQDPLPRIVSVIPGHAVHYLKKIDSHEYQPLDLLRVFWPLHSSSFNKTFLIKKLTCANNPELSQILGLNEKDKEIILRNVIVYLDRDSLVRIFFQTVDGKSFSSYGRFIDNNQSDFGLIIPMNEKTAAKYHAYFKHVRQELTDAYRNNNVFKSFKEKLEEQLKAGENSKEVEN